MIHELHADVPGGVAHVRGYSVNLGGGDIEPAHLVAVELTSAGPLEVTLRLTPEQAVELRDQLSTALDAFPIGVLA